MNTPSTSWHLDAEQAERYATGRVSPAFAASAEQHLTSCASCRALVPTPDTARLDLSWGAILDQVEAPRVGAVEQVLRRLGVHHGTARLVAATPALRGAWLVATVTVLALATVASVADGGTRLFVALAPVLPVLGVALCFGDRTDPMLEVITASPYSLVRLLAARTSFVVATSMVPALLVTPFLPGDRFFAVAWMVPALAMSAIVLAAAQHLQPVGTAAGLSMAWMAATLWRASPDGSLVTQHTGAVQVVAAAALAAATVSLVLHRQSPVPTFRRNS